MTQYSDELLEYERSRRVELFIIVDEEPRGWFEPEKVVGVVFSEDEALKALKKGYSVFQVDSVERERRVWEG